MWSAGEASPPLPDETPQHSKDNGIPKHALLFVGSGSQYVSMGHVLKDYKSAQRVWDEAEESLNGFEKWRRSLGLESCEGEVGELGRALEETVGIREKSMQLKEVVMNGPQVSRLYFSFQRPLTDSLLDRMSSRNRRMRNLLSSSPRSHFYERSRANTRLQSARRHPTSPVIRLESSESAMPPVWSRSAIVSA